MLSTPISFATVQLLVISALLQCCSRKAKEKKPVGVPAKPPAQAPDKGLSLKKEMEKSSVNVRPSELCSTSSFAFFCTWHMFI